MKLQKAQGISQDEAVAPLTLKWQMTTAVREERDVTAVTRRNMVLSSTVPIIVKFYLFRFLVRSWPGCF